LHSIVVFVRLLVVEDSQRLARAVALGLRRTGYAVDVAHDGEAALAMAEAVPYDLVVLDLMLPKLDGLTLLRRLREQARDALVLILTARDRVEDRVTGLGAGADDFLVKPFAFEELLARVAALLRRRHGHRSPVVTIGSLELDTTARCVRRGGVELPLAAREYAILEYLAARRGQIVTRAEIEQHVYDDRRDLASNAIDSAICSLRKRIEVEGEPMPIETRRGLGYVLRGPS
jgi:DNA-binding response OmpR family regulator